MAKLFTFLTILFLSGSICVEGSPHESRTNSSSSSPGKIWAFLVAGSSGYYNYRHQADISHAYQLLRFNGVSEENIVVMMADDVAYDEKNPDPGTLVNEPNGYDVYDGVLVDYDQELVTAENFLKVLNGSVKEMSKRGTGRVIESGPNDMVFVNYVDHGSPGLLRFLEDKLYAKELYETLKLMAKLKKFSKMFLFIEACYSGSMFDQILEDDLNIFVMTAADPYESSYACYYDETRGTYVADLFSAKWMEQVEEMPSTKSLHNLYTKVRTNTMNSHVEEYGDLNMGSLSLSTIFKENPVVPNAARKSASKIRTSDVVKSEDVPLAILKNKIRKANDTNNLKAMKQYHDEMDAIINSRKVIDEAVDQILLKILNEDKNKLEEMKRIILPINKSNMDCWADVSKAFFEHCFDVSKNAYVGKVIQPLLNICSLPDYAVEKLVNTMKSVCPHYV